MSKLQHYAQVTNSIRKDMTEAERILLVKRTRNTQHKNDLVCFAVPSKFPPAVLKCQSAEINLVPLNKSFSK